MKQNMKRILALGLSATMAAGMMSGYVSAEEKPFEGTELTIWMPHFWSGQLTDSSENEAWQKIAENLGLELTFIQPPLGQEQEQFNVMIASGEYPDIIYTGWLGDSLFTGGLDKYVADGVLITIDDLVEEYAPDYLAAIDTYMPDDEKYMLFTDNGDRVSVYGISPYRDTACNGVLINGDWLTELGLENPETLQEYEDVLLAFKEQKGATAPLIFYQDGTGLAGNSGAFVSAFNIGPEFYQVDGEVKYGPVQPEFKDYLTQMNKWYEMGLIDKDFATRDEAAWIRMLLEGESGIVANWSPDSMSSYMGDAFEVICGKYPVQNKGDRVQYRQYNDCLFIKPTFNNAVITTACENPEAALALLNYGYTQEGYMLYNYGVEGETWNYSGETLECNGVEHPLVTYTDKMMNNQDYPVMDAILQFKVHIGTFLRFEKEGNPTIVAAGDTGWERRQQLTDWADATLCLPPTSLTAEEGDEYAKIINQIKTYKDTAVLEFIMGIRSLDEFDSYVEEIKKLDVEGAVAIQQAALDRYYSRLDK